MNSEIMLNGEIPVSAGAICQLSKKFTDEKEIDLSCQTASHFFHIWVNEKTETRSRRLSANSSSYNTLHMILNIKLLCLNLSRPNRKINYDNYIKKTLATHLISPLLTSITSLSIMQGNMRNSCRWST